MAVKIIIDKMSEEQMQKVANYLSKMPNISHRKLKNEFLFHSEFYGGYVSMDAEFQPSINGIKPYNNVTFKLKGVCPEHIYFPERETKQEDFVKGLVCLLAEFLEE